MGNDIFKVSISPLTLLNFRELGEVLMSCGAFSVMEFINHFSPRFG